MSKDNTGLMSKLKLRRHLLNKYFSKDSFGVLDACEGEGTLWKTLQEEFDIKYHLGLDIKKKKGRLAVDSSKFLKIADLDKFDVFDLDAYGSPFIMYENALQNLNKPCIFFLTFGSVGVGFAALSRHMARITGFFPDQLDFQFSKTLLKKQIVAPAIFHKVQTVGVPYCVNRAYDFGFAITDFVEVTSSATTRYFGVRCIPKGS